MEIILTPKQSRKPALALFGGNLYTCFTIWSEFKQRTLVLATTDFKTTALSSFCRELELWHLDSQVVAQCGRISIFIYCFSEPAPCFLGFWVCNWLHHKLQAEESYFHTYVKTLAKPSQITWQTPYTNWGLQLRPKEILSYQLLVALQCRKLPRVFCQGENMVYDFWAWARLLSISSWLNVISLLQRNRSVHFLIYLDDTLTAFPLIQPLPLISLPLLIIFRNEIYGKKGLNQFWLPPNF